MKKILVVDDEPFIVTLLTSNLEKEGYKVTSTTDGSEGLGLALEQSSDFIILDVVLPTTNDMEITQRLRQEKNETLVLMLTAKDDQVDRVIGLKIGAGNYLTKLFSSHEVLTCMRAIFRRIEPCKQSKDEAESEYLSIGQTTADLTNYQVTVGDHLIELIPKEFELLICFMKRKDRVIDQDTSLDRIWNFDFTEQNRIVDVYVSHLQEKIERDPKRPEYLVTIGGFSYEFQEPKR